MSIHEAKIAVRLFNLRFYAGDKRTVSVGEEVDFRQSQCLDGEFNGKYVKVRGSNKVEVGEFSGYTAWHTSIEINPLLPLLDTQVDSLSCTSTT